MIIHHGHYIESMYLLMSNLNQLMFNKPLPTDVAEIEEDNFAWIDFFWSSLGRSGRCRPGREPYIRHASEREGCG